MSAGPQSRTASAVRLCAVPTALLSAALSALAVGVHLLTPVGERSTVLQTPEATIGPALAVTAALVVRRSTARRLPVLLLLIGLCASTYAAAGAVAAATDGRGAAGATAAWLAAWTWTGGFPLLVLLPGLFPDGRLPSPRWRPLARVAAALTAALALLAAAPGPVAGLSHVDNPLGVDALAEVRLAVQGVVSGALLLLSLAALASLGVRWRRAGRVVRHQLAWLGYGAAVVVAASFLTSGVLLHLLSLALPAAVGVAVVRYRLYDIGPLVDRTVVGAVLLAGAALVYAAVVGWAGAVLGPGPVPGFVGAAAVALLFAPARRRVEVAVDRMLHGRRGDPYALLAGLASAVQGSGSARTALRELVAGIADGLRLPGVLVRVELPDGGAVEESAGDLGRPLVHAVDLRWQGEVLGVLRVTARPGADALEPVDRRVLAGLAGQLAPVACALRLSHDLEASRSALVAGVAEERRRLRRDLHDGLGPQLAAVALGLSTAERALARDDAARAQALLTAARDQLETGVAEVRRLVHGLRPPALDDLGLLDALRTTGPAASGELEVEFAVEGDLTALPAAVEVAAYRIVQEALTNVVRHSGASRATVALSAAAGALALTVTDAGCGIPVQRTAGVGTSSMRERAEEVGGTCAVGPGPGGGTVVHAHLPLPVQVSA